jgi:hypothetical protein
MLELLLFPAPFLHFLFFNQDYVGKCLINDLWPASPSPCQIVIIISNSAHLVLDLNRKTVPVNIDRLFAYRIDKHSAICARTEEEPRIWRDHNLGDLSLMGRDLVK